MSSFMAAQSCQSTDRPYADGEEIVYKVYYNLGLVWIGAGEVVFKIRDRHDHIEYSVTGRTFKAYDPVFMVRDYYVSHLDKESCLPTAFKRNIMEGTYVRFDSISFQQEENSLVEYFGKSRQEAEQFQFSLADRRTSLPWSQRIRFRFASFSIRSCLLWMSITSARKRRRSKAKASGKYTISNQS